MPPQEGKRFELIEGEIIEVPFASFPNSRIAGNLFFEIDCFLRTHPLGEVYPCNSGFLLNPATVLGPDVSFLRTEHARLIDPNSNHYDGAPDLAVEVVSPSDTARNLQQKVDQYLKAGANTVWVVYPDTREVQSFASDRSVQRYGADDLLETPQLLPGFSVPVREFFE